MMQDHVTRMPSSAALRLCLIAGLFSAAGCWGSSSGGSSPNGDKLNDPALKAYMAKTAEAFKAKTQPAKKAPPITRFKTPQR